jgi:hypothetical protein
MKHVLTAALAATFLVACGGGGGGDLLAICPGENTTPASTDPDYAPDFGGNFYGTVVISDGTQSETLYVEPTVRRTSANKLSVRDFLRGKVVGLVTTATTADLSCMTGTVSSDCGTITLTYDNGVMTLVDGGNALEVEMDATAAGCGDYGEATVTLYAYRIGAPMLTDDEAAESADASALDEAVLKLFRARRAQ